MYERTFVIIMTVRFVPVFSFKGPVSVAGDQMLHVNRAQAFIVTLTRSECCFTMFLFLCIFPSEVQFLVGAGQRQYRPSQRAANRYGGLVVKASAS